MAQIQSSISINAPLQAVWNVVSDIDNEPKYWKGTKAVRNISKEDSNNIEREVTIAFKDSKCIQKVRLYPNEKIQAEFTQGVLKGTKTIILSTLPENQNATRVDVFWDVKLSGLMGMLTGMVKNHIRKGTEQALENIKQEAEKAATTTKS